MTVMTVTTQVVIAACFILIVGWALNWLVLTLLTTHVRS